MLDRARPRSGEYKGALQSTCAEVVGSQPLAYVSGWNIGILAVRLNGTLIGRSWLGLGIPRLVRQT